MNPEDFENSMSIIGQLKVNNVISTDDEDILIAMVGQEVRGKARLEYVSQLDQYMVFMDIYTMSQSTSTGPCKFWDNLYRCKPRFPVLSE